MQYLKKKNTKQELPSSKQYLKIYALVLSINPGSEVHLPVSLHQFLYFLLKQLLNNVPGGHDSVVLDFYFNHLGFLLSPYKGENSNKKKS